MKAQQALQWWSKRQSGQLLHEAEKIRDGLLQESFTMRRSLELLLLDNGEFVNLSSQDWLNKINKFHHSLEQLSDRLSLHIEHSLPLSIQCIAEAWQGYNSNLSFKMELPNYWKHEPHERSMTILKVLNELLKITLSELIAKTFVQISLKLQGEIGELVIHISYPDLPTLRFYKDLADLKYLSQTFMFLTSGQCYYRSNDLTLSWYFSWITQENIAQV